MEHEEIYSITSASTAKRDEVIGREVRYAISMGVRTACFIGAVITWKTVGGWLPWALLAGSMVLPYTSVILANAGVRRRATGTNLITDPESTAVEKRSHDTL